MMVLDNGRLHKVNKLSIPDNRSAEVSSVLQPRTEPAPAGPTRLVDHLILRILRALIGPLAKGTDNSSLLYRRSGRFHDWIRLLAESWKYAVVVGNWYEAAS